MEDLCPGEDASGWAPCMVRGLTGIRSMAIISFFNAVFEAVSEALELQHRLVKRYPFMGE
jgi:hypothetical protein